MWKQCALYSVKEAFLPNNLVTSVTGTSASNHAFIAQRNLAERARLLVLHSSDDGRIGSGAISR